jgi:hypothetical protein
MPDKGPHEWEPQGGEAGTLGRFIYQNNIKLDYEPIAQRPDRDVDEDEKEQEWQDSAFHYKVTLKRGRKTLTTFYSKGQGLPEPPEADEVLDSLASDAEGVDASRVFNAWAEDFGYDTDSRRHERIYNACKETRQKLKRFLGDELYKTLVYETERL